MLNICVIDDRIPVNGEISINDTVPICQSLLELIISKNTWGDSNIKELISKLLTDKDNWQTFAFTNPEIYLNALERDFPKPDIIVFDWEYAGGGTRESGELLLEILNSSFVIVYVYTGQTHKPQVEQRIDMPDLNQYQNKRLYLLMKEDSDSPSTLLRRSKEIYDHNFSFKFGSKLRKASRESIEEILVKLGEYDINFIKDFLSEPETKETDIKMLLAEKISTHILEDKTLLDELITKGLLDKNNAENLLQLIKTKFRDEISSMDIDFGSGSGGAPDINALKDLWSYRIYYRPSDNQVRKGDIIKNNEGNYYLVVTPDCNLTMFWHKNFGYINLIPLWDIVSQAQEIKKMLSITRNDNGDGGVKTIIVKGAAPNSISENLKQWPEGCFLLPYIKQDNNHLFLMGFSKAICSVLINPKSLANGDEPKSRIKHSLDYGHWVDFKSIATISEPFLTPIIQKTFDTILGVGTPNFSEHIKNDLKAIFQQTHNTLWPTP